MAVVMMGVSGAGKTTVGQALSEALQCSFYDADDFHSEENRGKMRASIPISDADRRPWLEALCDLLQTHILAGQKVVLACSALKRQYRDILRTAVPKGQAERVAKGPTVAPLLFIYLSGSYDLFFCRLEARYKEGRHYMPPSLLRSQLDALEMEEKETGIISVDANLAPETIVKEVLEKMSDTTSSKNHD